MEITKTRIRQLTRQREALIDQNHESGAAEGRAWAQSAEYWMLDYAVNHPLSSADVAATVAGLVSDPVLGEYWSEKFNANPLYPQVRQGADNAPTQAVYAWLAGWFEQVKAYWEAVQREMEPLF